MAKEDKDGLEKNLEKMEEAIDRLKASPEFAEHLKRYRNGKWFSTGKDNKLHTLMNVYKEATEMEPYLMSHVFVWIILALGVSNTALALILALT